LAAPPLTADSVGAQSVGLSTARGVDGPAGAGGVTLDGHHACPPDSEAILIAYRICHDDPDWHERLERLERTLSTHQDLDEAIEALHAVGADNTRQLSDRGDARLLGRRARHGRPRPRRRHRHMRPGWPAGTTCYRFTDPGILQPDSDQPN